MRLRLNEGNDYELRGGAWQQKASPFQPQWTRASMKECMQVCKCAPRRSISPTAAH